MLRLNRGRYAAREAVTDEDVLACQRLRHRAFVAGTGALPRSGGLDSDAFDALCRHFMVEELKSGARSELAHIDAMGGAVEAIEYMKSRLVDANAERIQNIESGETFE